jgi:membrane protease YdiL (CAAX protease family)
VPWQSVEVALVAAFFLLTIAAAVVRHTEPAEPLSIDRFALNLAIYAIIEVAVASVLIFFLFVARQATPRDIGLDMSMAKEDLLIGAGGFLAAVGPVYTIQITLLEFIKEEPHPVLELLRNTAGPAEILAAVLSAVVVAPLFEEFIFRIFIQGWLEKAFAMPQRHEEPIAHAADVSEEPALPTLEIAAAPGAENPYVSPALYSSETPQPQPQMPDSARPAVIPILLSSILFAAVHVDAWPSPIPLFPLALILGYVYWRTHRLLPCVVLHALFNGLSVLAVALYQLSE